MYGASPPRGVLVILIARGATPELEPAVALTLSDGLTVTESALAEAVRAEASVTVRLTLKIPAEVVFLEFWPQALLPSPKVQA